jgi:hypothetical protein
MMRFPLLGLTGPARSGKDTAAAFLLAMTGGYRYAFADPIRAMLKAGLGIDMTDEYWIPRKEDPIPAFGNKSPRQMMQWLGTEWGRQLVDENLWLTLATDRLMSKGPGMIVTDCRFENEAAWIRRYGGRIIHLRRNAAQPVHGHLSEGGVQEGENDFVVHNNGTLEDLQERLREIVVGI